MNRLFVLGIAAFVAVVGIALFSGDSQTAFAGHGCCGGSDCSSCCGGDVACCGGDSCCGGRKHKLFSRLKNRCSGCSCSSDCCCGEPAPCCGGSDCGSSCGGTVVTEEAPAAPAAEAPVAPAEAAPAAPEAPVAPTSFRKASFGFRAVSFRR